MLKFEVLHRKMERFSDVYVHFEAFRCFFKFFALSHECNSRVSNLGALNRSVTAF